MKILGQFGRFIIDINLLSFKDLLSYYEHSKTSMNYIERINISIDIYAVQDAR